MEKLQISAHNLLLKDANVSVTQIAGYFCSDTVFNLSNKALTDIEKGTGFAAIQRKINEPELKQGFCRGMRTQRFFRNEPTPQFSEVPAFSSKSSRKPQNCHPNLEVF